MTGAAARAASLMAAGRAGEAADLLLATERHGAPGALGALGAQETRLLVRALSASGDLNAALDRQAALVPKDIAGADQQGRADTLAAARLAQLAQDHARAEGWARALAERDPGDIEVAGLLSTLLLWSEGPEAAAAALAGVLDRPDAPPQMLAQALEYANDPDPALVARLEGLAQDTSLADEQRGGLLLVLAQYCDRAGDAERAWALAEKGNALLPARPVQDWHGVLRAHLAICRATPDAPRNDGPRHAYLAGLPRSGQSLVQSLVAASPQAASLGERGALLQHILFRTGPIAQMPQGERAVFYAELAQADARGIARLPEAGEAALVLDKSPLHLPVLGSVARIHPGAMFGAVLRDPAAMALSIWLRNFPPVYDYANDMDRIVAQIGFALDALEAWREEGLPIRLFEHGALVSDPAATGEQVFDWLGLEWDEAYLDPAARTAPVATFSAAQVRRPIGAGEVRGIAGYEAQLAPWADRFAALRERTATLIAG